MRGFDLDGTLCASGPKRPKPYRYQTGPERRAFDEQRGEHYRTAELIMRPEGRYVIITGRSERFLTETEKWVEANSLTPEGLYLMKGPRTRQNMIAHKRQWCERLGIAHYYEDDSAIAWALARSGVRVVLVT